MTELTGNLRASCLVAVILLSILSPVVFATGTVGAAENVDGTASVTVPNAAEGERTNHDWNVTVGSTADRTLQEIRLTYAGTGSNLSNAYTFRAAVRIDGSTVAVDTVSSNRDSLHITLANGQRIDGGETIAVTAYDVENPSQAGTYDATFELHNSSATFIETSDSFEIVQGGNVNGTVTNTAGSVLSGASVTVANASTGKFVSSTSTNSNGDYSTSVPAGTYTVTVTAVDYETVSQTVTEYETVSRTVSVTSDSETTTDVSLRAYGVVNGTVTDNNGTVGNVGVFVVPHSGPMGAVATTGSSGSYSANVAPGDYDVIVDSSDESEIVDTVRVNSDASTVADLQLTEPPETGIINGTIVDSNGDPISGAVVNSGDSSSRFDNDTVSDGNGQFSLKVPTATYRVTASATGFADGRLEDVTVSTNETTNVRIQLDSLAKSVEQQADSDSADGDNSGSSDAASGSHQSRVTTPTPTAEPTSTSTAEPTPTSTAEPTPTAEPTLTPTDTPTPTMETPEPTSTTQETPGFGVTVGAMAVITVSMLVRHRRSV